MPEMDGFTLTRAIRAEEADTGRHNPIIAFTTRGVSKHFLNQCKNMLGLAGASPYGLPRSIAGGTSVS